MNTSVATSKGRSPIFATTHWSVVLKAGRNDTTRARDALSRLCQTYWFPLYAYVRRRGYSPHDAQDLTQEFFARLLERESLNHADPNRGRFRSFLLTAMNNFLATEWKKARAKKRCGGDELISLDLARAEERYDLEPVDTSTPDRAFDKQWGLTLLETVLGKLETEYTTDGKTELFERLKQTLTGSRDSLPYAELALKLQMNESALKVTVHRLRKRYRELIQDEISNTVASPDEVNQEMRYLFEILTSN